MFSRLCESVIYFVTLINCQKKLSPFRAVSLGCSFLDNS